MPRSETWHSSVEVLVTYSHTVQAADLERAAQPARRQQQPQQLTAGRPLDGHHGLADPPRPGRGGQKPGMSGGACVLLAHPHRRLSYRDTRIG